MSAVKGSTGKVAAAGAPTLWRRYAEDTRRPLVCLLFLFPLVATYEFGALMVRPAVWPERELVAHSLIQKLLSWFGASGFWVPAAALVVTLVVWQVLGRHAWRIRGWVLPVMLVESVLLTVPLFVLGRVMLQAGAGSAWADLREQIVLALGAGIYEELVFRLYLIVGLMWLLEGGLGVSKKRSGRLVVGLSAAVFAVCHFGPIGSERFAWRHFVVLVLAGAYLAMVFLSRGLGIAAGCHVAFNLIPLVWGGVRG